METLVYILVVELGLISMVCVAMAAWVIVRKQDSGSPKLGGAIPLLFNTGKEETPKLGGSGEEGAGGQYL